MNLGISIEAAPSEVWAHLADLGSHSHWMADADEVTFSTDQTSGVGTVMRVASRVGPFRTDDVMMITEWVADRLMVARHEGVVTGEGRFEIYPNGEGSILVWSERLRFPWWLGGRIGAVVAGPFLRAIWVSNLARLKLRVESS